MRLLEESEYLPTMLRACESAAAEVRGCFGKLNKVISKGVGDFFTEADLASERILREVLSNAFPNTGFLMEESGSCNLEEELCWIIDPIDGTKNFIHGNPYFCISVGLQNSSGMLAGIIYRPMTSEAYIAHRGRGALHIDGAKNTQKLAVSDNGDMEQMLFAIESFSSNRPMHHKMIDIFAKQHAGMRMTGSIALNLAHVAAGIFDGFIQSSTKAWDIAAGSLIVQEAGGIITDISGRDRYMEELSVVASNKLVHPQLIDFLTSVDSV